MPGFSGSVRIDAKPKAEERFRVADVLLLHILQTIS
jgi:hypothetical protein